MTTPRIHPAATSFDSPATKTHATVMHDSAPEVRIVVRSRDELDPQETRYQALYDESDASQLTRRPAWVGVLHRSLHIEVPSASSLRRFNSTNANMLLYWRLLARSVERRQKASDFGCSSPDSGTYRFKCQWGARPTAATWQYCTRRGTVNAMRPGNSKYRHFIQLWQRMPVFVTNRVGPLIVRGIP